MSEATAQVGGGCIDEATTWADALGVLLARIGGGWLDRVIVLRETGSTQDAARRLAGDRPGLVVLADRQTRGRGRLGRSWTASAGASVTATFVLDGTRLDDATLSLVAGLAALEAVDLGTGRFGLRWPNDVVERASSGRKAAGVLVERSGALAYVGVGLNVLQHEADWPEGLRGRAVSMREAHPDRPVPTRLDVVTTLTTAMLRLIAMPGAILSEAWQAHDVLVGKTRTFVHDNRAYQGRVERVEPGAGIRVWLGDGALAVLPAATTSLVHEEQPSPSARAPATQP